MRLFRESDCTDIMSEAWRTFDAAYPGARRVVATTFTESGFRNDFAGVVDTANDLICQGKASYEDLWGEMVRQAYFRALTEHALHNRYAQD